MNFADALESAATDIVAMATDALPIVAGVFISWLGVKYVVQVIRGLGGPSLGGFDGWNEGDGGDSLGGGAPWGDDEWSAGWSSDGEVYYTADGQSYSRSDMDW